MGLHFGAALFYMPDQRLSANVSFLEIIDYFRFYIVGKLQISTKKAYLIGMPYCSDQSGMVT